MFVGLHRHSHYSKRDGIAKIPDIVERVAELGQEAWALTDHGTTSGLIEAYKATQKYNKKNGTNIKFIFGCEFYWIPDYYIKDRKQSCHLLVLAKNDIGYRNLLKLVTIAYGDKGNRPNNYFYTMRINTEDLEKYKEGLIITSACMGGILNPVLNTGEWDKDLAYTRAERFKSIFEDFYLEIQTGETSEQKTYNNNIVDMAKALEIPLIVTEDSHYVYKADAKVHRQWLGISSESDYYQTDDYYIHSEAEVRQKIQDLEEDVVNESIANTTAIAKMCEVNIKFGGKHFPVLDLGNETPLDAVKRICREGWKSKIIGTIPAGKQKEYVDQLQHEFDVLEKCDYLTYFLMTEDFLRWARSHKIRMGVGRGSVGGSLVAYLMDITRIDPIKYGLVFERFAHDKRVSLPDIDSDVMNGRRADVIQYLVDKYVEVFHVRTFGVMADKAAVTRAGQALGIDHTKVKAITKLIKNDLTDLSQDEPIVSLAYKLKGIIQNFSVHASAIMLFPSDPAQWVAIEKQGDNYVCAYAYPDLEAQGLLKLDVLGIKTLDAIDGCMYELNKQGIEIDLDNLPDVDEETFKMLSKGETKGCFQVESGGMVGLLRQMKPTNIFDLIPLVALFRPSTLQSGMVDSFVKRRAGEEKSKYAHPNLEPILSETYGVLLYQEQAMKVVQVMAGYDLGQADMFRRAIGHKVPAEMAVLIPKFVADGEKLGINISIMNKLAEWLTNCAAYQFNKSHSAAYGVICYQTAYIKAHYPAEYLCSYLNAYSDEAQEDMITYIDEIKSNGIKLLPPDARKSSKWEIEIMPDGTKAIRMGLSFIKGVGNVDTQEIKETPIALMDIKSLSINKNKLEAMIKAGAFDFMGNRVDLLAKVFSEDEMEKLNKQINRAIELINKNNLELDKCKDSTSKKANTCRDKITKYSNQKMQLIHKKIELEAAIESQIFDQDAAEMEVLGMNFKDPFDGIDVSMFQEPDKDAEDLRIVIGLVTSFRPWKQKNGKPMAFVTIRLPNCKTFDVVMFNFNYVPLALNKVYRMSLQGDKFKRVI